MKQRLSSLDGPTAIPANLYNLDLSLAVDKYRPGVHTLKDLESVLPVVHKRARSKPVRSRCVSMPVSKLLPMVLQPLVAPPVPPKAKHHKQHRAVSMAVLDTLSEHSEPAHSQYAPAAAPAPAASAAPAHLKMHSTARWSAHSGTISSHSRDWSAHSSSGSLLLLTLYHPSARLVLLVQFSSSFQPDHCPAVPASMALSRRHSATTDVVAERFALLSPEPVSREELLLLLFPLLRLPLELLLLELLGILVLLLLLPLGLDLDEPPGALRPPSFNFGAPYQSTGNSDLDASVNGKLLKVVESYLHSPQAMTSDATSCYSDSLFSEHEEKSTSRARQAQLLQQRQPAPQPTPLALPKTRRNRESIQSVQSAHSSQSSASLKEAMQEVKQIVRQRPFSFALDSLRDYGYLRYFAPARPAVRSASAAAPHTPSQVPTKGRQNRFGDRSAYRHASAHT
jgi:hypothetical protein